LDTTLSALKTASLFALAMAAVTLSAEREDVLKPYEGPSVKGSDPSTLKHKVMTGYQGWFNAPGDGSGLGWVHWSRKTLPEPGNVTVDLWPDVSEYDADELYDTGFFHDDGTPGRVFSSHNRKTVLRHMRWMQEYGIDGAFVQRFSNGIFDERKRYHKDKVLSSVREGANRYGRTYAVMYDLSGTQDKDLLRVFDDWKLLRDQMDMGNDPAYQHLNGKPLVAIWGVGFSGEIKQRPDLYTCKKLIELFKANGCSVMLGIPTGWREQTRDGSTDPNLHEVLLLADVLSPWSIGRFRDLSGVQRHTDKYWADDIRWARNHKIDYLPVVFPGFSWHNLNGAELRSIPRLKGKFLWEQIVANQQAGADMIYIAMFDEVDEATAIFKCTNHPPNANGEFIDFEGLPGDFYLRLAGKAGQLLRGEIEVTKQVPVCID
jgi:hypothetical protein